MANRTTFRKVREIYESDLTDENIEQYIGIATNMVDNIPSGELTDTVLADIERFLTAHLIIITKERRGVQEEIGEGKVRYSNIFGEGLMATEYGQMVSELDTTGTLKAMGKKKASIIAVTSFE
jgi:hypothetical protein